MKNVSEKMYEVNLPIYLEKDLKILKEEAKKDIRSLHFDCFINELQGSVDSAFVDGDITKEQYEYFYRKYIEGGDYK